MLFAFFAAEIGRVLEKGGLGVSCAKVFFAKRDALRVIVSDAWDVAPGVVMSCISLFVGWALCRRRSEARRAYATMEPICFGCLVFRFVHLQWL